MANTKTFTYPFRAGSSSDFAQILNNLNSKIDDIKKRVSYFDFYNITGAVTDSSSFASQLNSLPLNQALVINTNPFYHEKTDYSPGDIVIKNYLGEIYHIKAQTGGVYYPKKLTQNSDNTYTLQYEFSGDAPTAENGVITTDPNDENTKVSSFAEKISFSDLTENQSSNIYGFYAPLTGGSYTFEAKTYSNGSSDSPIWPFIQFFLCADGSDVPEEQVFIDYSLKLENNQWTVTAINSNNLYVKVK